MAEYTENLNLILPKQTEGYDVEVANTNNKAIDAAIGNKVNKVPGKDLSTNDFTNGYKQKIDSMQRLYKFKGSISTYDDLSEIEQTAVGDVYNVLDTNNNYCWDGIQWVELGIHIDLSEYENQLKELETKQNEKIEESKAEIEKIKQDIQNGTGTGGGGGDSEEVGSVKLWFSNTIPQNWLLLNGQAISRTEYNELFAVLGTTYGAGDGSTTFNLPDLRGYVPVGLKSDDDIFNVLGKKVGEKKHTMTIQELIEHYHIISRSYGGTEGATYEGEAKIQAAKADGGWTSTAGRTASSGGGQPFNIIQPSIVCNFIIKAKQEKTVQKDLTLSEILEEVAKSQAVKIVTGQETATNEYIDNKRVYVKRINLGAFANADQKYVSTGLSKNDISPVDLKCFAGGQVPNSEMLQYQSVPYLNSNNLSLGFGVSLSTDDSGIYRVCIMTSADRTWISGYANIYYTKKGE